MTSILTNPHVISNVSFAVMLMMPIYLSLRFKFEGYLVSIPVTWFIGILADEAIQNLDEHRSSIHAAIWFWTGIPTVLIYGYPFVVIRAIYDDYFAPKDEKTKNATSNDVKQPNETPE